MEDLVNLAKIVTNRRLTSLPLVSFSVKGQAKSKEEQLLNLLVSGEGLTNLQVVKRLYENTSAANHAAVRKLKERLHRKLLNHLFFLDHADEGHPAYRRHEQQCLDMVFQATMLFREGERIILPQLLRKLLKLALAGEFTSHAITACEMLRVYHTESNEYIDYQNIKKRLSRLYDLLASERETENLYWESKMKMIRSVTARRRLLQELPETIQKLETIYQQVHSYNVYEPLLKLRLMQQELSGNFEEIIRITGEAERDFAAGKLNPKRFDSRFTKFYSLYAHLRARRLKDGLALAENYLQAFHRSSNNWFAFLENYYLLAMHNQEYALAGELLRRMQMNPFASKLSFRAQQRWELMRAYLFFVRPEESRLKPVRFAQFVQRIPDHSRDKQGYNVAILILQFLYYLQEGNVEALLMRLESLRKYEKAHLGGEASTLRSRLMFRLLQLTVKENFKAAACEKKGQTLLAKLRDAPPPGEAYAEIEIIPYENLWERTLVLLRQRNFED